MRLAWGWARERGDDYAEKMRRKKYLTVSSTSKKKFSRGRMVTDRGGEKKTYIRIGDGPLAARKEGKLFFLSSPACPKESFGRRTKVVRGQGRE